LKAPRPARLPDPKPPTIKPKDSRYERGTTGGQVMTILHERMHQMDRFRDDLGG
jgi:hypothetical protein